MSGGIVSQVLNGGSRVRTSEATRQRVLEAARSLGYVADRYAKGLRTGRRQVVAICATELSSSWVASIVDKLHRLSSAGEYALMICTSGQQVLELSSMIDGVISLTGLTVPVQAKKPLAVVYLDVDTDEAADQVRFVLSGSTTAALELLHQPSVDAPRVDRILHLTSAQLNRPADERLAAYRAFAAQNLANEDILELELDTRKEACEKLLAYCEKHDMPRAVFCRNDEIALGVYAASRKMGLKIPEDLSVVGCDGLDFTEYIDPSLTTIKMPLPQACEEAWDLFLSRLENPELPPRRRFCEASLIVQSSTRTH